MPVGFKNGTGGSIQIAVDAIRSAAHPHHFLSVTKQGLAAIVNTRGNTQCHLILRGGSEGPNYDEAAVSDAVGALKRAGIRYGVMVDCSHANSRKKHENQRLVAENLAAQLRAGSRQVFGVMLESFLVAGRQDVTPGKALQRGQSITDACMSWEQTLPVLQNLAAAVVARRAAG
jgi:3-deoxy-7-phosphoheptulonate synthase